MTVFISVMDRVNKLFTYILILLISTALVSLSMEIFGRALFRNSFPWSAELARYCMIWITFIGAGLALRSDRLIKLEIMLTIMPKKVKPIIEYFSYVVTSTFFVILIIYGIQVMNLVKNQTSAVMQISMAIPYAAIPIGACIMLCNTLVVVLARRKGAVES